MDIYQVNAIKFTEFTTYTKRGHQREYQKGQILRIRHVNRYDEGELMPRDAALLVQMKKAEVYYG